MYTLQQIWKTFFKKIGSKILERKRKSFSKKSFLGHTSWLKSSKMNFYGNPTTDFVTRLPYIVLVNLAKIRKIPMLWDILQWAPSYIKKNFDIFSNRCPSMRSLGNPRDDFADSVSNPLKIEYCEFEVYLRCTASETPNQDVKRTFFE